jgi:hypothetical protein
MPRPSREGGENFVIPAKAGIQEFGASALKTMLSRRKEGKVPINDDKWRGSH